MPGLCDPSSKSFCIYNIPICGGFCAPTQSTEKSCFRHFSNEFTLPGAPKFMKALPFCEQNVLCISVGKIGCACADRARKAVMMTSCAFNCLAMILLIVATIGGLSTQPARITKLAWVRGTGSVNATSCINMYMGLTTIHNTMGCLSPAQQATAGTVLPQKGWSETSPGFFEKTVSWDDQSACFNDSPEMVVLCEDCKQNRLPTSTLFISIFGQLPTMATNLQRTTRFGDVNCQASIGILSNVFSLLSSMAALVSFRMSCMANLPTSYRGAEMSWDMGPGYRLLLAGTLVKIIDIICHCAVPTPRQRWEKPGPEVKDTLAYLSMAPPRQEMDPVKEITTEDKASEAP